MVVLSSHIIYLDSGIIAYKLKAVHKSICKLYLCCICRYPAHDLILKYLIKVFEIIGYIIVYILLYLGSALGICYYLSIYCLRISGNCSTLINSISHIDKFRQFLGCSLRFVNVSFRIISC